MFIEEVKRGHEYGAHIAAVACLWVLGQLHMNDAVVILPAGLFMEVITDMTSAWLLWGLKQHVITVSLIPRLVFLSIQRAFAPAGCVMLGFALLPDAGDICQ